MQRHGARRAVEPLEIHNARAVAAQRAYTDFLYRRLQRHGALYRDCQRMVNQDRNIFAACMVACGDADAMVTGATRNYFTAFEESRRVIGPKPGAARVRLCAAVVARALGARRRHHGASDAERRRSSPTSRCSRRSAARGMLGQEPRVALLVLFHFRQSDPRRRRPHARRRSPCSTSASPISNMTAR